MVVGNKAQRSQICLVGMKREKYSCLSFDIYYSRDLLKLSSIIREITVCHFHRAIAAVFDMEVQTKYRSIETNFRQSERKVCVMKASGRGTRDIM